MTTMDDDDRIYLPINRIYFIKIASLLWHILANPSLLSTSCEPLEKRRRVAAIATRTQIKTKEK